MYIINVKDLNLRLPHVHLIIYLMLNTDLMNKINSHVTALIWTINK